MTIPNLLARWAVVEPGVCKLGKFKRYEVGEYSFGFTPNGTLYAVMPGMTGNVPNGQPALDWLLGCVMRAIMSQEGINSFQLEWERNRYDGKLEFTIWGDTHDASDMNKNITESLLTAYLDWLEAQDV